MPLARMCARYRYITLAFALVSLLLTAGYVAGVMRFAFLPKIESDFVVASARLPVDATFEQTKLIRDRLVKGAKATIAQYGGDEKVRSPQRLRRSIHRWFWAYESVPVLALISPRSPSNWCS